MLLATPETQDVSTINFAYNLSVCSPYLQSLWITIITEAVDNVRYMSGLSPLSDVVTQCFYYTGSSQEMETHKAC